MHYWGHVIETLTHESAAERTAALHRRRRRDARPRRTRRRQP